MDKVCNKNTSEMMTDMNKKEKYIMLSNMNGIGPVGQHILLDTFGGIEGCFRSELDVMDKDCRSKVSRRYLKALAESRDDRQLRESAEKIAEYCSQNGIDIITIEDQAYPDRMRCIPKMPVVFYIKGQLMINEFSVTQGIIGARRCTRNGKKIAIDLALAAASSGAAVISGMAKGIDSYAHTACIKSDGYTIAVLGNGPDICYPEEHLKLYESILAHGCILSEYPPGTKARRYYFPERNRIIAALSDEIHVIDAGRNSGTESTVEFAKKYNRRVHIYQCEGQ